MSWASHDLNWVPVRGLLGFRVGSLLGGSWGLGLGLADDLGLSS